MYFRSKSFLFVTRYIPVFYIHKKLCWQHSRVCSIKVEAKFKYLKNQRITSIVGNICMYSGHTFMFISNNGILKCRNVSSFHIQDWVFSSSHSRCFLDSLSVEWKVIFLKFIRSYNLFLLATHREQIFRYQFCH